jgi:hypothetical protein
MDLGWAAFRFCQSPLGMLLREAIGVLSPNNAAAPSAARIPRSNFTRPTLNSLALFGEVGMIKAIERGSDGEKQRVIVGLE